MRRKGLTGAFWPSTIQEELLRAAFRAGPAAAEAWRRARGDLDLDRLEPGSYSLMPLVYRRLTTADVDEALLPRLKGIYRHTWSKNQVLLGDLRRLLETFGAAGIDVLALGGAARLSYYEELGSRTLSELEVLVRERDLQQALRAVGWTGASVPARVVRGRATVRVETAEHRPFGLHWHFLPEYPAAGDEHAWRAASRRSIDGLDIPVLHPSDELLHTIVGGARTALWANVQWVADAATIIDSGTVDWERLVGSATERRATLQLREGLRYVSGLLGALVPAEVLAGLGETPTTRRDRLAHRVGSSGGNVLGEFPRTLARFIRSGGGPARLVPYLRDTWNVDRTWQLPLVAARKGAATIVERRNRRGAR